MSCSDSTISAQRDADLQVFFAPQSGFTFSTSQPTLRVWDASSSALSPLLTVEMVSTPNGSAWSYDVDALELLVTRADLQALPDANLYFDITLLSNGVVYPFTGGDFDLQDDGSEGKGCGSQSFTVSLEGKQVPVLIQGGGLSRAMANGLQDLNTAVSEAQQASQDAEAAAQAAIAASANKLDTDGDNATTDILSNLQYLPAGSGSVPRSQKSKNDDVLNALDFIPAFDGSVAQTGMENALMSAILRGMTLKLPIGRIALTAGLAALISGTLPFAPAFGAGVSIQGSGPGTILETRASNEWLFDIGTGVPYQFNICGELSNLSIVQGAGPYTNCSGVRLRSTVNFVMRNVFIDGLSGSGFDDQCLDGDPDGNVLIHRDNVRISDCKGWGWNGAAAVGHNENSGLTSRGVFVQNCGTPEYTAITGITQANPAVVTSANHGRVNGDLVYIGGAQGMSQVNTSNSETAYVVAGATTNTFQLQGVNSTGYGAYTSGGHVMSARPKSGGVKWKGQITKHEQMFLTLNENVSFYIENGPATAQTCDLAGVVLENIKMVGGIIAGVSFFTSVSGQNYANAAQAGTQAYIGWGLDGTTDVVQYVSFKSHTVRVTADNPDYAQWVMIGPNVAPQTCRVGSDNPAENTLWKEFDYSRQRRFSSRWLFDHKPKSNIVCVAADGATAYVQPSAFEGNGRNVPIRLRYSVGGNSTTGEVVNRQIGTIPITKPGGDGLYYIYLRDEANVITSEASLTAPAIDPQTGIMMKSDDFTRTYVGALAVVGGDWLTTSAGYTKPLRILTSQPGVEGSLFFNRNDRQLKVKDSPSLPSAGTDANFGYWPTFEGSKTHDFPSIAAGATATTTINVVGNPGDPVKAVTVDVDQQGLILSGYFSAGNTITVVALNPPGAAGPVDLASTTLRVFYERR